MSLLTLNQAAKEAKKAKATLLEAIQGGRLSATRNELNQWQIDPAELFRVYPADRTETSNKNRDLPRQKPERTAETLAELLENEKKERERERDEHKETIKDLRRRLDEAEEARKEAAAENRRLNLMLTHQPEAKAEPAPAIDGDAPKPKSGFFAWAFARAKETA